MTTETLLDSVRSLPTDQLEEFAVEVMRLTASRRSPSLSKLETEALTEINRPLPAEKIARYRELIAKRDASALSVDEHHEICTLSDWLEERNSARLGHVANLARSRGLALTEMMNQLGLEHLVAST